jgi:hypothetical protein
MVLAQASPSLLCAFSHSAIFPFHRLISRTRRVRLWLLMISPSALAAGEKWVDIGYVFTTETGTPIEPDNLRRVWYPLRDEAGLGKMRFHVEQLESRGRHHFGQRTAEHHHHGRARCLPGQTGCTTRDPPFGFPPFRTTYGTTAETSPQR